MKAQQQFTHQGGRKPIGSHRHRVKGGKPVHGKKMQEVQELPSINHMFHIHVCFFGSLIWVNVDPKKLRGE